MPWSCASAKPSGCGIVRRHAAAPAPRRGRRTASRRTRTARRRRGPAPIASHVPGARRERERTRVPVAALRHAGRQMRGRHAETLRRRHRRLLGRGRGERALDRAAHESWMPPRIAEAHLDLLRMHVDVDAARIDVEPQRDTRAAGRGAARRDTPRAARAASTRSRTKRPLTNTYCPPPCAAYAGRTANPVEAHVARVSRPRAPRASTNSSPSSCSTRAPAGRHATSRCATRPLCCSVNAIAGCASAMRAERFVAMAPLGRFGAQELAPRRRVEEELLDGDRGARRERGRRDRRHRAALDLDAPRMRLAGGARGERQARHRGDRRQRLAAEAERGDRLEVEHRLRSWRWHGVRPRAPGPRARCPRRCRRPGCA